MAGSASTITYDDAYDRQGRQRAIQSVTIAWTSDSATGAVTAVTEKICGWLIKGVTIPSGGGTAPTDNYDIAITDPNSVDILTACKLGLGNRDTANTEETYFFLLNQDATVLSTSAHPVVCDKLTVAVTNAGNSKQGTIILYYCPG